MSYVSDLRTAISNNHGLVSPKLKTMPNRVFFSLNALYFSDMWWYQDRPFGRLLHWMDGISMTISLR